MMKMPKVEKRLNIVSIFFLTPPSKSNQRCTVRTTGRIIQQIRAKSNESRGQGVSRTLGGLVDTSPLRGGEERGLGVG
jgi:hypothetical protein